jgi:dihydrofolate synthase/folylpolyglutamate synthase
MTGLALKTDSRQAALSFLYQRIDYERAASVPDRWNGLNLERMRDLLARLGNPERRLRAIHLAGTKGKGSTATMVSAILRSSGFRVGLYTSPHLQRLEERFVTDGDSCEEQDLVRLVDAIRPALSAQDAEMGAAGAATFFEITTAMAMLHFVQQSVDLAIFEVGMGGRLDSTNVCQPLVSVITSISFDHTRQLGNTLANIAAEKAGIIKPGVPVVSGVQEGEARDVIRQAAESNACSLVELGDDFTYEFCPGEVVASEPNAVFHYREVRSDREIVYDRLPLALRGRHQAANAAVAVAAVHQLGTQGYSVPEIAIRQGLATVHVPARVEFVSFEPRIVVDTAHNVASIKALVDVLKGIRGMRRRVLIFATTQDKDVAGMLELLIPEFDDLIFTRYLINPRSVDPDAVAAEARRQIERAGLDKAVRVFPDPQAAWSWCRAAANTRDLVCVTGSFFLAAELREVLRD